MIPKHSEIVANIDFNALLGAASKVVPRRYKPLKRHPRGVPQRIEARGNYLVQGDIASARGAVYGPTEAQQRNALGKRAAKVVQDGLLPVPGLSQRSLLYGK